MPGPPWTASIDASGPSSIFSSISAILFLSACKSYGREVVSRRDGWAKARSGVEGITCRLSPGLETSANSVEALGLKASARLERMEVIPDVEGAIPTARLYPDGPL